MSSFSISTIDNTPNVVPINDRGEIPFFDDDPLEDYYDELHEEWEIEQRYDDEFDWDEDK